MELKLSPRIPVTHVVNGHNVFNKGYRHDLKGKTYEEYYGEEKGKAKRQRMSASMKGHRYWGNGAGSSKKCLAICDGMVVGRFSSISKAAKILGMNDSTIRRYITGEIKSPAHGWRWFFESDIDRYLPLLKV